MTTANLDISVSRISIDRIEFSRRLTAMVAMSPSKQAERNEIAALTSEFEKRRAITVFETPKPDLYPASQRKQEPDIAARNAAREKQRKRVQHAPDDMYSQPDVMTFYGYDTTANGYKSFALAVAKGEIPEHDHTRSAGPNKFYRFWWQGKIDKHLAAQRTRLAAIVEKYS